MSDADFTTLDTKELQTLLESAIFKFAETMADSPHWYTLKETWSSEELFNRVVMTIRRTGEVQMYGGWRYMCLDVDGYRYWTMGSVLRKTILINKAVVE